MKVVFWSPTGHVGTTSSMLLLSLIASLKESKATVALQTHISNPSVENYYTNYHHQDYMDSGLDALSRRAKATILTKEYIKNCITTIYPGRLDALPSTKKTNVTQYEEDMISVLKPILNSIDTTYSVTMVDTRAGESPLLPVLHNEADVLVLCSDQGKQSLDQVMSHYQNMDSKTQQKCMILLTNYDGDSKYNRKNVKRKYHYKDSKIAVIPHNTEFMDAFSDRALLTFYMNNRTENRYGDNYTLISEASLVLSKIIDIYQSQYEEEDRKEGSERSPC